MSRREFIAGLGSAAVWPVVASALQAGKLPAIGYLASTLPLRSSSALPSRKRFWPSPTR